jgi:vacuolar protein sorting-associated protein 1
VVVGSQSAGKSSLLEQIVGIDFLPRGSGVVTRRPLELRLIYEPKETLAVQYGEFKEIPGKKFTDFKEVKRMIEELTDKVCGKSKNIIDNPIILNVHSSSCPNLTLVDLPGITKVPIDDQPPNIGEITTGMCRKYIEDEKTIILCVVAANADLSTSDSLKLCRSIDKDGVRTLGCLTKIDLMDRGTNARNILLNKEIELKLGYVAIKNRSQEDINQNRSVAESLAFEKTFFSTSQIYSSLPPGLTGTDSLTNKLTNLLYNQIKKFMPELIREIGNRLDVMEEKKKKLGDGLPVENAEQQGYLWQMTSEFLNEFKGSIEGSYSCDVSNQCGP